MRATWRDRAQAGRPGSVTRTRSPPSGPSSSVSPPPWRAACAAAIERPSPVPGPLHAVPAREALEHVLALGRRDAGAVVVDEQLRAAGVQRRGGDDDLAVRPPVQRGVLDEVVEQHAQALGLAAHGGPSSGASRRTCSAGWRERAPSTT